MVQADDEEDEEQHSEPFEVWYWQGGKFLKETVFVPASGAQTGPQACRAQYAEGSTVGPSLFRVGRLDLMADMFFLDEDLFQSTRITKLKYFSYVFCSL